MVAVGDVAARLFGTTQISKYKLKLTLLIVQGRAAEAKHGAPVSNDIDT